MNHGGYRNPSSCDSLSEGFAGFLPTLCGQTIDGDTQYAGFMNLDENMRAWDFSPSGTASREQIAAATMLWDLVDANVDTLDTLVIGEDEVHREVTYSDTVNLPLSVLWIKMVAARPLNVHDLLDAIGFQDPTRDLDGDGIADVAPLDEVFLMHGFFPIDAEQNNPAHETESYPTTWVPLRARVSTATFSSRGPITANTTPGER
jgi:hypothetical protein